MKLFALVAALAMLGLSACGSGKSGATSSATTHTSSTTTSTSIATSTGAHGLVITTAGGVRATLRATTHRPKVNVPWPIAFTVSRSGAPLRAKVRYEYLFGGGVVAKRSNYTFTGRFADNFRWPPSAVGYPLTFRAVIVAAGQTLLLDYPVQVAR